MACCFTVWCAFKPAGGFFWLTVLCIFCASLQLDIAIMQAQMETMAKEKGDMFDTMVVDEAKIRLGEEGWKERYYQVGSRSPAHAVLQAVLHG